MKMKTMFSGALTALILTALGCSSDSPSENNNTPATVRKLAAKSPVTLSGTVGRPVDQRPTVRTTGAGGFGMSGVKVTFTITSGGGVASRTEVETDWTGSAIVGSWALGSQPGVNTMTASAVGFEGSPVTFTATAIPAAGSGAHHEPRSK